MGLERWRCLQTETVTNLCLCAIAVGTHPIVARPSVLPFVCPLSDAAAKFKFN